MNPRRAAAHLHSSRSSIRRFSRGSSGFTTMAAVLMATAIAVLPSLVSVCDTACFPEPAASAEISSDCAAHEPVRDVETCEHPLLPCAKFDRLLVFIFSVFEFGGPAVQAGIGPLISPPGPAGPVRAGHAGSPPPFRSTVSAPLLI